MYLIYDIFYFFIDFWNETPVLTLTENSNSCENKSLRSSGWFFMEEILSYANLASIT